MEHFERRVEIAAPAARVFSFHERPDALMLLTPPGERTEIIVPPRSLEVGTRVELRTHVGPFPMRIVAVHREYVPGRMFADEMVEGPFARWYHRHIVEPLDPARSVLIDAIDYQLPLGVLGATFGRGVALRRLNALFDHRHAVTRRWCESTAERAA